MGNAVSKSTKSPAFQFYPKDFLTDSRVRYMSMTERGIYITLLSMCWTDDGLPSDLVKLAHDCGMKAGQFQRLWDSGVLHECFYEKNGRLYNPRLDKERKIQSEYRRRQTDNANKRWDKPKDATAVPSHPSGNAPLPRSLPRSLPQSASERRAPLHASHRTHASCGRVCVPAALHGEFVRRRNHDGADKELRDWYLVVDQQWSEGGEFGTVEPGDAFVFWKARYAEKWPAPVATKDTRPEWMKKAGVPA